MKKKIGYVIVDSGEIMIIDPCYIDSYWEKGRSLDNTLAIGTYDDIAKTTLSPKGYGQIINSEKIKGLGFVISNFGGDGKYPVYAEFGETEKVKKLTIDFEQRE